MKAHKLFPAFLALCFLCACAKEDKPTRQQAEPILVRDVELAPVQAQGVEDSFESVGTVKAIRSAVLSSKTVGTVVAIPVKEGDRIKKGQTLVEIDSRDLQAELQAARAALEEANSAIGAAESTVTSARGEKDLAEATFKRYQPLVGKGSVTPHEFDEVSAKQKIADAEFNRAEDNLRAARARKTMAMAKVSSAETLLGYTKIMAPFDGVVTAKPGETGALASPGTPLITVEQTGPYRLEAQVGESSLANVKMNMAVPVSLSSIKAELTGKVVEIVPAADPQSRTFTIKIELPSHPLLHSGQYGRARFVRGKTTALLVPSQAVVEKGQLVGVYVADDSGLARLRLVTTGKSYGDKIEILSGLTAGERIVIRGKERVSDGSRIALPAAQTK